MSILVAIAALAPGFYAWWSGRTLLARVDDPAFPELVLARAQRRTHVVIAVAVVSATFAGNHWLWSFPLLALALLVGDFPFRRALYAETWHVGAYIGHMVLGFVGAAGFWLTLAFAPSLVSALVNGWTPGASPVEGASMVGVVVAIALIIWEINYARLWLGLHRGSPFRRADLTPRFDEIVARSAVAKRPPQVYRYGFDGAYVMNAIALPSVRQPRVAFGDSLLELLTPDEIVAVFAHEVSHLEHYDRRRMLRLRLVTWLLILGGTALPAATFALAPAFGWAIKLAWPVVVLALLALRLAKSQAHETESDLRAGELTGDPEAMVRALTKLHHYSRMPRRWPYDFERAASHPSLARRIQALRTRSAGGSAAPVVAKLGEPTVLRSTEPGAYVVLDDTRAYWFDGVPADVAVESLDQLREQAASYRAVSYTDLAELRVAVLRARGRALLARDSGGKTWSMPLRTEDVAAAQRALDILDVRLGTHEREDWRTKARVAATLLALTLVGALDFSWTWLPLVITLAKPSAAATAAMGSMVIGRLILAALAGTLSVSTVGGSLPALWLSVAAMLGIGVWSCRIAWRWTRGDNKPAQRPFVIIALAMIAVLLVAVLALTTYAGNPAVGLPFMPSVGPAGAVALFGLGLGAALLTYGDRLRRRSGAALCLVALALGVIGAGGRELVTRRSNILWTSGAAEVMASLTLEGSGYRLSLSPGGRLFAVQAPGRRPARYEDEGNEEETTLWRFRIGSIQGIHRTTDAFELAFLDDERALVLRPTPTSGDSLDLSLERADGIDSTTAWRRTIPAYYAPTLTLDRVSGMWRVSGHDVHKGTMVTSVGRIGSDSVSTTRLASALLGGRPLHTYRDGTSLIATLHGSFGPGRMFLSMLGFYPFNWDLWHVADGGRKQLGQLPGLPECASAADRDDSVLCLVQGRSGVSLWRFANRDDATATVLGALPMTSGRWDIGPNGRVAAASYDGRTLALVDAVTGRGTRISLADGVQQQGSAADSTSFTHDIGVAADVIATLVVRGGASTVTFYRIR